MVIDGVGDKVLTTAATVPSLTVAQAKEIRLVLKIRHVYYYGTCLNIEVYPYCISS